MKMLSEIQRVFVCDNLCISERKSTLEASFTTTFHSLPDTPTLMYIINLAPVRDNFILKLSNDSDVIYTVSNKQSETIDLSAFIDGMSQDDIIEVKIQIDKSISENKFSIYCFEKFADDLLSHSIVEILDWFSKCLSLREYLVFEVFDSDILFSTGTMAFVSNENATFHQKIERFRRLSICKEAAYFYNMNAFEVIPEDFIIEGIEQSENKLKQPFAQLATILAVIYSVSSASIADGILSIQINGQRTTSESLKLNDISENIKWLSIYSWIFTDGNPTDKALIHHRQGYWGDHSGLHLCCGIALQRICLL